MINRRELLALAASSAAGAASTAGAAPRLKANLKSRASEIRALRLFAEATHPRGREARDDRAWQHQWATLERSADGLSDGAYFVRTRHALAWFEDGHTTILPFEYLGKLPAAFAAGAFGLHLPWKVKAFDDGVYVVKATAEHAASTGARVDQVGSLSSAAFIKAVDATWPGNRAWTQNWVPLAFASPGQLQGLGAFPDPTAPLQVALTRGNGAARAALRPSRGDLALSSEIVRTKTPQENWAVAAKRGNYVKLLPERRAIYVSNDDMDDEGGATFQRFTKEIFDAMQSAPADRLILDLRRNGGGDNFLGEPVRKHIERSSFNQPGRLFVLIGPQTFSAAQNFANRLERETYAIFVGTPTGLSPNHYGDANIFTGPATGLTAMVSTLPWFDSYPADTRVWIMPDLLVPATFADWRSGGDPALDAALTQIFVGAPDDVSPDRTFYYQRASQKQEWKPFWV